MASKAPRVFASAQEERRTVRAAPGGDAGDPVFSGCGGRVFGLERAFAANRPCDRVFLKQAPIAAMGNAARAGFLHAADQNLFAFREPAEREARQPEPSARGEIQAGRARDRMGALREQRAGQVRLHRDERKRHRRLAALQVLVERSARGVHGAKLARPQDSQRAVAACGVQTGLRAQQAKLREAAGAAQLGGEAHPDPRREILRRNAQYRRREQIHRQSAFSSARLITLPPNPERLNSTRRSPLASPPEGARPSSSSGFANPQVAGTRPRARLARSSASSAGPLAPRVWPSAPFSDTDLGAVANISRTARPSARSARGPPPDCSLIRSTAALSHCARDIAARIVFAVAVPSGAGPVTLAASIPVASAAIRQGAGAADTSTAASASPRTSPSRSRSQGRAAVAESSWSPAKPATVRRLQYSTPSTSTSRNSPAATRPSAISSAEKPEVQVVLTAVTGPRTPNALARLEENSNEGSSACQPPSSHAPTEKEDEPTMQGSAAHSPGASAASRRRSSATERARERTGAHKGSGHARFCCR